MKVTVERLKELYTYDSLTGLFTFNVRLGPMKVGDVAGAIATGGYIQISIDGKKYPAHRLVWLYMTGEWPDDLIDHKDTVRTNNRFNNLRVVTSSVSNRNRGLDKRNKSGVTGVAWDKSTSKWYAYICVESQMINLGKFEYKEDAILARMTAEKKYNYWVDRAFDNL